MAKFNVNKAEMDFLANSHRKPDSTDVDGEKENNRMRKFSFTIAEILEVIGTVTDLSEEINFYVGKLDNKLNFRAGKTSAEEYAAKLNIPNAHKPKLKFKQVLIMTKATDVASVAANASIDELFGKNAKPKIFPTGSTGIISKICPPPPGCA